MGIAHPKRAIRVSDAPTSIRRAVGLGMWTVAVTDTSALIGTDDTREWDELSEDARGALRELASHELTDAGAHFAIPNLRWLPLVVKTIEWCAARGVPPRVHSLVTLHESENT